MYGREHNKKENFSRCESTELIERVSAAIARGKRPVPFRTRKLSLSAPMVLQGGPCGRVGHRRTSFEKWPPRAGWPFRVNSRDCPDAGRAGGSRDGRAGVARRPASSCVAPTQRSASSTGCRSRKEAV